MARQEDKRKQTRGPDKSRRDQPPPPGEGRTPARGTGAPVGDVRPTGTDAELHDPDAPIRRRGRDDFPDAPPEP